MAPDGFANAAGRGTLFHVFQGASSGMALHSLFYCLSHCLNGISRKVSVDLLDLTANCRDGGGRIAGGAGHEVEPLIAL